MRLTDASYSRKSTSVLQKLAKGRSQTRKKPELQTLGRRVRQLRESFGWAQIDLAAHVDNVQRAMISDIETGRRNPSLKTLLRLAEVFEVPVACLFLDPTSGLQHRVATKALTATDDELRPVAKLLDLES